MTNPVATGFTLPPKLYDFLKFAALVLLPAVATLLLALVPLLNWNGGALVAGIVTIVDTFLGTILGKSSSNNAAQQLVGDLVVGLDAEGAAEIKRVEVAQEMPIFQEGRPVVLNVRREHPLI